MSTPNISWSGSSDASTALWNYPSTPSAYSIEGYNKLIDHIMDQYRYWFIQRLGDSLVTSEWIEHGTTEKRFFCDIFTQKGAMFSYWVSQEMIEMLRILGFDVYVNPRVNTKYFTNPLSVLRCSDSSPS